MGHGQRPRAVGSSKKWKYPCCRENTQSTSEEEWPTSKVGSFCIILIQFPQENDEKSVHVSDVDSALLIYVEVR